MSHPKQHTFNSIDPQYDGFRIWRIQHHLQQITDYSIHHKDRTEICHHLSMIWLFYLFRGCQERATMSQHSNCLPIPSYDLAVFGRAVVWCSHSIEDCSTWGRCIRLLHWLGMTRVARGNSPLIYPIILEINGELFNGQIINKWRISCLVYGYMGMDQYLLIPFLVGWTSIYQLFGFDTLPYLDHRFPMTIPPNQHSPCQLEAWETSLFSKDLRLSGSMLVGGMAHVSFVS